MKIGAMANLAKSDIPAESLALLPLTILEPVFNDWERARLLVERIDLTLGRRALKGQIIFIDDGSLEVNQPRASARLVRRKSGIG
jgi:hypothetical protein